MHVNVSAVRLQAFRLSSLGRPGTHKMPSVQHNCRPNEEFYAQISLAEELSSQLASSFRSGVGLALGPRLLVYLVAEASVQASQCSC